MRQKNTAVQGGKYRRSHVRGMYGSTYRDIHVSDLYVLPGYLKNGAETFSENFAREKMASSELEIVKGKRIRIDALQKPAYGLKGGVRGRLTLRRLLSVTAVALVLSAVFILMTFQVKKIVVYGTEKYSPEEIEAYLTKGCFGSNTLLMALKYHNRAVTDIDFIDRIDIDFAGPSTIRVNIKERPSDGYIFYKGKNVFFSREGMIQTVSSLEVEGATRVDGVVLTHANKDRRALAKNQYGLDLSLELMRVMEKYGIRETADCISVDEKSRLTVSFGEVKVQVGRSGYDAKMCRIQQILPSLKGRSGIINMTGSDDDYSNPEIILSPEEPSSLQASS